MAKKKGKCCEFIKYKMIVAGLVLAALGYLWNNGILTPAQVLEVVGVLVILKGLMVAFCCK